MKLPTPLALALQTGFNNYLALDSEAKPGFEKLRGKLILLQLSGLDLGIYFLIHSDHLEILEQFDGEPDATISGGPLSMLALASGRSSIFDGDVAISGDVETAQQFSRSLEQIDIDWEEHLSRLTGDTVAHQMGRTFRGFSGWVSRTQSSMRENTADYLRDETNHLPYDWELTEFSDQVDDLRDRVDQLAIRIEARQAARDAARDAARLATAQTTNRSAYDPAKEASGHNASENQGSDPDAEDSGNH